MSYDQYGNECEVLSKFDGGFVVRYLVETDDDSTAYYAPQIIEAAFDSPPIQRKADECESLNKAIEAKRSELHEIEAKLREAQSKNQELLDSLKAREALAHIDDFLAGKITHYVTKTYRGHVVSSADDAKCESQPRFKKLLTLFGATGGDLRWHLNKYKDGSGPDVQCWPCTSKERAEETARRLIAAEVAELVPGRGCSQSLIDSAKEFGVEIPSNVVIPILKTAVKNAEDSLLRATNNVNALSAQLEAAKAELSKAEAEFQRDEQ